MSQRGHSPPRLLADEMLGRLARWLRLAGYDTAYLANTDDLEMIRVARAENRLILTRDGGLAVRQGVEVLWIESRDVKEQLEQVVKDVGPLENETPSRCSVCNVTTEALSADAARERVPPYVFRTQKHFMICRSCNRVYWPGTHWQAIRSGLDKK